MTKLSMRKMASMLLVPGVFAGGAIAANVTFIQNWAKDPFETTIALPPIIEGKVTAGFDTYYRQQMPYRLPSIGLLGALRYRVFNEGRDGVVAGQDGWLFTNEEFEEPSDPPAAIATAANEIAAVERQLADQGIKLVVAPLPAKLDIYREHGPDAAISDRMQARYDEFVAALGQEDIDTIDTRSALLDAKDAGQLFLKTDTHWSPEGAGVVAKAIARGVDPLEDEQAFTLEPAKAVALTGDLTKFISDEAYIGLAGLAAEQVTPSQAVARDSGGGGAIDLFGAEQSFPIVLVGTSYSANENWSFAEALKAAAGADVLNLAEEGRGPFAPMHKMLEGDQLAEAKPQVVVWEFPIRYLSRDNLWDPEADFSVNVPQKPSHQEHPV